MNPKILITEPSADYELLDSGDSMKLERFGDHVLSRPDPQALWNKKLSEKEWNNAAGQFERMGQEGKWKIKGDTAKKWIIEIGGLKFNLKPSSFKHVGVFPEQSENWKWLRDIISAKAPLVKEPEKFEVLNLFGYTGGATLACAAVGASVVHIDSSKTAMTWARENATASGLDKKPIRWILEDAREFVKRELRRGRLYDGIIMDPPSFGHGSDDELWKIESDLLPLIADCMKLLKPKPSFFLLNGYSAGYSAIAYRNILADLEVEKGGNVEFGELTVREKSGRLLPSGIFARWSA